MAIPNCILEWFGEKRGLINFEFAEGKGGGGRLNGGHGSKKLRIIEMSAEISKENVDEVKNYISYSIISTEYQMFPFL